MKNILIVENNNTIALDLEMTLKKFGYHVVSRENLAENAIKKVKELKPDLILMDIKLSGKMDGIEAAEHISQNFDLPLIYLTAYSDNDLIQRAKKTEPCGYLLKPFNDSQLYSTIEIAFYTHQLKKELNSKNNQLEMEIQQHRQTEVKLKERSSKLTLTIEQLHSEMSKRKELELTLIKSRERYRAVVDTATVGIMTVNDSGQILFANKSIKNILGYSIKELLHQHIREVIPEFIHFMEKQRMSRKLTDENKVYWQPFDLNTCHRDNSKIVLNLCVSEYREQNTHLFTIAIQDITRQIMIKEALNQTLDEVLYRNDEMTALLDSTRAVLKHSQFDQAAKAIFKNCKNLLGASAGYVALLDKKGQENEVLFLNSGQLPCDVNPDLPMPIRGLRAQAYQTGKTQYLNDFSNSEHIRFLPKGHVRLKNVLFAPLIIEKKVVGLIGFANKATDFTPDNARIAAAFGELAAIALVNSRNLQLLTNSEERFRSLVESATEAIITFDENGKIVLYNSSAETMFGYPAIDLFSKPFVDLMSTEPDQQDILIHDQILFYLSTGQINDQFIGKTIEANAVKKSSEQFPIHISFSTYQTNEGRFYTAIMRDITERKQIDTEISLYRKHLEQLVTDRTKELINANEQLKKLYDKELEISKMKDEFTSNVNHELRTPLTSLLLSVDYLNKKLPEISKDDIQEKIARIERSGQKLLLIVNELLDFSRLGAGKFDCHLGMIELHDLLNKIKELFIELAESKGLQFTIHYKDNPLFENDFEHTFKIVGNMVSNAIKFTQHGSIDIVGRRSGNFVVITVQDTGVGINNDHFELIFDRFSQGTIQNTKAPGTGIGLHMVKRLCERHGGKVSLESEEGKGSVFTAKLPLQSRWFENESLEK